MIARPREAKGTPRQRALIEIATTVTEAPWRLRRPTGELDDDALVHAIALSAYFGHLNRIADAVAVPLDYDVRHMPPPTDPAVPALPPAPVPLTGTPALTLARRPATAAALDAWSAYVAERAGEHHPAIASWVAGWLGDGRSAPLAGDPDVRRLAELVTLAPWQLDERAFASLRACGWDDARLFDVVVAATTAGVTSRIHTSLVALAQT